MRVLKELGSVLSVELAKKADNGDIPTKLSQLEDDVTVAKASNRDKLGGKSLDDLNSNFSTYNLTCNTLDQGGILKIVQVATGKNDKTYKVGCLLFMNSYPFNISLMLSSEIHKRKSIINWSNPRIYKSVQLSNISSAIHHIS